MSEFKNLIHGDTLEGWKIYPRGLAAMEEGSEQWKEAWQHPGQWTNVDGVIEGRQDPPGCGFGSYLVSEGVYGDFELVLEAKPDWPADTGIYLRASDEGSIGYQVLLDHRKSGSIGGYYGNSIGGFHAINWNVDADYDENGVATGIKIEDPETTIEPIHQWKRDLLTYKITGEEFLKIWKWNDWNEFRIVCKGEYPVIETYINGAKVAAVDMSTADEGHFFREKASQLRKGRIAFEVHDNDPGMGKARWGETAACRWRNVRIREL